MIEPSFFYGAMFVGYAITVATCVSVFIIASVIFNLELLEAFTAILLVIFFIIPLNLRLSRILWINMFIAFDKNANKKATS
jgi:hypothetical protein